MRFLQRLIQGDALEEVRTYVDSPGELSYQREGAIVVRIPVENCRMNLTGLVATSNPFVTSLRTDGDYSDSPLFQFYNGCAPKNVGALLCLTQSRIVDLPPMAAVMPWWCITPEQRLNQVAVQNANGWLGKEAIKEGALTDEDYGWQYFGPVSPRVGAAELKRQREVYNSIRLRGYRPDSYRNIHGEFLLGDERWAWVNLGGKHRFNALVALGGREVVVSAIRKYGPDFVRRSDYNIWPNVMNGWFTPDEALDLFDRILNGR